MPKPPRKLPAFSYPRAGFRGDPRVAVLFEELLSELADHGVPLERLGPSLVAGFAAFYRMLPREAPGVDKNQVPLLYQLLGSGTPPLKMSKADAAYQDRPVGQQHCGNCSSAYEHLVSEELICSQIEGVVAPQGWCRLWSTDRL